MEGNDQRLAQARQPKVPRLASLEAKIIPGCRILCRPIVGQTIRQMLLTPSRAMSVACGPAKIVHRQYTLRVEPLQVSCSLGAFTERRQYQMLAFLKAQLLHLPLPQRSTFV